MCERFRADTPLSMCKACFWSIITHMVAAILEISHANEADDVIMLFLVTVIRGSFPN